MKTRINIPAESIRTREQMEALVGEITALKTKEQKLTADMNRRVNEARQDYEASLGAVAEEIDGKMAMAREWAEGNIEEFGTAKSIAMTHGIVGWKVGNPTLKPLAQWTWDRVLEKLKAGGIWNNYLRVKPEVDKEGLLADRETLDLKSVGVRVVQVERFFVDPKIETVEARVKGAA